MPSNAMRRLTPRQLGSVCQRCAAVPAQAAHEPLAARALRASSRGAVQNANASYYRSSGARWLATASAAQAEEPPVTTPETKLAKALRPTTDPGQLASAAVDSYTKFTTIVNNAPDKDATAAALQSCLHAASSLHPHLRKAESQAKASASRLALLGAERAGTSFQIDSQIQTANNQISQAAYNIITHPNVEMTPDILELYVHTQAQLGRPESLPSVLELYAHKARPVVKDGKVQYVAQNPNAAVKAIEKPVADLALQTAIDARNLDAALGITEKAFCVKAFKRQKLIKRTTAPAMALASLPFGILGLGTAYANYWQNTMDVTTATGIGVAGISGYFLVTGSLGMIAKLSHKDQMKRVTWIPGTPLRYRWMREEEREALDKIACSWGFKETWRHGEETGPEWEGLREYMGYRQMILDRVEFMEGMN